MTELMSSLDLIVEYISDDESLSKTNFQALIQSFKLLSKPSQPYQNGLGEGYS